eukprot:scaffold14659_cov51-Phaeocystis_antarctica.AAC.1
MARIKEGLGSEPAKHHRPQAAQTASPPPRRARMEKLESVFVKSAFQLTRPQNKSTKKNTPLPDIPCIERTLGPHTYRSVFDLAARPAGSRKRAAHHSG